jgi:ElaB/YqjD/DUF883 family membrane-anchored ribosome-binding protein
MNETTNPQDRVQAAKEHLKAAADNLNAAAEAKAAEFQDEVASAWSDAKSRAQTWKTEVVGYVRENPSKAFVMAVGLGFVFSRRIRK